MTRLEQLAINASSMRDFVSEILNIQERFGLPDGKQLLTAKELREIYIEVHREK